MKMLEKVLKSSENSPAYASLEFALNGATKYKARKGRPRANLLSTLQKDVKCANFTLDNTKDIQNLKEFLMEGGSLVAKMEKFLKEQ